MYAAALRNVQGAIDDAALIGDRAADGKAAHRGVKPAVPLERQMAQHLHMPEVTQLRHIQHALIVLDAQRAVIVQEAFIRYQALLRPAFARQAKVLSAGQVGAFLKQKLWHIYILLKLRAVRHLYASAVHGADQAAVVKHPALLHHKGAACTYGHAAVKGRSLLRIRRVFVTFRLAVLSEKLAKMWERITSDTPLSSSA